MRGGNGAWASSARGFGSRSGAQPVTLSTLALMVLPKEHFESVASGGATRLQRDDVEALVARAAARLAG